MNDLQRLIAEKRGDRGLRALSRDCGGTPNDRVLGRMVHNDLKAFPERPTVEGLARGLGVSVTRVLLACASSLGYRVQSEDETVLVLPGAGTLPPKAQETLLDMSRELQNAYAQPWGQSEGEREYPPLRLAASEGHAGVNPEETEPST